LVEIAPSRFLLALSPGYDFHQLELTLNDLLEEPNDVAGADRELVSRLLNHFKGFRKSESVRMAQILLVRLQPNR
jgi:hypothetical protein